MSGLLNLSFLEKAFTSGSVVTISGYIAQRPVMTFTALFITPTPPTIARFDFLKQSDPSFGWAWHCLRLLSYDKKAKNMHGRVMQAFTGDTGRTFGHHKH